MKASTNVIVTAGIALVASGGVLVPIHGTLSSLEDEVVQLESQQGQEDAIAAQRQALTDELDDLNARLAKRTHALCANTPEAKKEFEAALSAEVNSAGLRRISMERQAGTPIAGFDTFSIALVVEGSGFQLHELLVGLESLRCINRVVKLDVQSGDRNRRSTMNIAVLLEKES